MKHLKIEGAWDNKEFEGYVFIDTGKKAVTTRYYADDEDGFIAHVLKHFYTPTEEEFVENAKKSD